MREFVGVHVGDTRPGIGTLVLNREPTNALTRQFLRELASAADEVSSRDDIAVVILFGGHDIFCSGDDIAELRTLDRAGAETADRLRDEAVTAVARIAKPTVAAVTGYALGTGLSLALAADWRICGDNAKLGATEILDGHIPGGAGASRLARTVGFSRAKELTFSGRFVGAKEALALGLIDELVAPDHVYDSALSWAQRFVDSPPEALAGAKARIDGLGCPS